MRGLSGAAGAIIAGIVLMGCSGAGASGGRGPASEEAVASASAGAESAATGPAAWFDDTDATGGKALADMSVLGGVDVEPGVYRVAAPVQGDGGATGALFDTSCKYGTYSGAERGLENLVVAKMTDGGHPVLRIGDGQRAYSTNCGRWELIDPAALTRATHARRQIGDGTWTVGIDLQPGTWRWDGQGEGAAPELWCVYQVDSSYDAEAAETLDAGLPEAPPAEVTLEVGQRFMSEECGVWRRIGG